MLLHLLETRRVVDSMNPYETPASAGSDRPPPIPPPATLVGAAVLGARLSFKWVTYIMGPVCLLLLLAVIAFITYLILFVHGIALFSSAESRNELLKLIISPFVAYLLTCMWCIPPIAMASALVHGVRRLLTRLAQQRN